MIDLDTIDVSNLNRQFLFRPRHVGMPKAVVAREMCMAFNPEATIVAYHANIKVRDLFEIAVYYLKKALKCPALEEASTGAGLGCLAGPERLELRVLRL